MDVQRQLQLLILIPTAAVWKYLTCGKSCMIPDISKITEQQQQIRRQRSSPDRLVWSSSLLLSWKTQLILLRSKLVQDISRESSRMMKAVLSSVVDPCGLQIQVTKLTKMQHGNSSSTSQLLMYRLNGPWAQDTLQSTRKLMRQMIWRLTSKKTRISRQLSTSWRILL